MTEQSEVIGNENYTPVHDHGFVGVVDVLGTDDNIVRAARVSYGKGTKKASEDRTLIRYLLRHNHGTPFEMCEIIFHLKIPIFVMRQLVRHRIASINEYSGRYSIMSGEFYMPDFDHIRKQSKKNKQGSEGEISDFDKKQVHDLMENLYVSAYAFYSMLTGENKDVFGSEWEGIARETARLVLPVANYTELYWKINLRSLFNFLKLRLDEHAQREIREYANEIYKFSRKYFPVAIEAFDDYVKDAYTLSALEIKMLSDVFYDGLEGIKDPEDYGMSKREQSEFRRWLIEKIL